jgi:glyoxylase-like metal-dependent hydrolase (beta-lactamase superfamily II)
MLETIGSRSKPMEYEVYTCQIGKYSCKIIRDLMFTYLGKDYFINPSTEQVAQELMRYQQTPDNIPSPFIVMLLENGSEKILIDTGIGHSKEPILFRGNTYHFKGKLMEILTNEKVDPATISHVILTHLHPDHIGGVFNEAGKVNFPNAQFFLHEDEWNYWFSSRSANQSPLFKLFIEKNISPLSKQHLTLIKGKEAQILPAVTAIETPGHTPGQIALRIASEKDNMLYISDAFLHPLHIEHLDWQTNYDVDHELARASRMHLLQLANQENMQINAFHFKFPGIGRAEKSTNSWKWVYTT